MKKNKKMTSTLLLTILLLICVHYKAQLAAPTQSNCAGNYSITNFQGLVISSGSLLNQNPIPLGALCPGSNLIVQLVTPSTTLIGAFVSIATNSTPITFTLQNFNTNIITIPIPINAYDPTQQLPGNITVGFAPTGVGDGCWNFTFPIYPAPNPAFIISPNPVCLNSSVCFSLTGASAAPLAQEVFGYYNGPMTSQLYANIQASQPPDYTGTLSCSPATLFGLGTHTVTNVSALNTLVGGNSFCFNSVTHTFQVVPPLGNVSIDSPTVPICTGQPALLTASATGATSFTWLPGNIVGNPITVNPTVTTSYTVIAANGDGCTNLSEATVIVAPCCLTGKGIKTLTNVNIVAPGASTLIWSNLTNGGTFSGNIALPFAGYQISGNYNVLGNLTISTPVTFVNNKMAFAEAAAVIQNSLTTINKSYWFGCQYNWKGISSNAGITISNSVIEDAQTALGNGSFGGTHAGMFVTNTIFNKNVNSIVLLFKNTNNISVRGCIFTSRVINPSLYIYNSGLQWSSLPAFTQTALLTYNTGLLKGSTVLGLSNQIRGQLGVALALALQPSASNSAITIGNVTFLNNNNNTNFFDNIRVGIYEAGTSVVSVNNYFQSINYNSGTDNSTQTGGIYSNSARTQVGSSTFGPFAALSTNTFIASEFGVTATNNGTLSVSNNLFQNISSHGIDISNWYAAATNNFQNTVTNNKFVTCMYDLYCFDNQKINLSVSTNTSTFPFAAKPKTSYNVYISELGKNQTALYNIGFNSFSGKHNAGVYTTGVYGANINSNTITIRPPSGISNAPIWMENTDQSELKFNTLNVSPSNSQGFNTFGIYTSIGINNLYCENDIKGAGSALKFQGTSPSRIYRNNLNVNPTDPCQVGIFLDNSGFVGPINYPLFANFNATGDNQFGDFTFADTYTQLGSIGSQIDYQGSALNGNIYYPSVNIPNTTLPPFAISAFGPVSNNVSGFAFCGGQFLFLQNLSRGIPPFISNLLNFGANNANSNAIANKSIFELFRKNAISTNSVSGSAAFMNANSTAAIGKFNTMDSLVGRFALGTNTNALTQANALNTSLVPTTIIETNQKTFNSIYHTYLLGDSLVTAAQLITLKTIAALCPFTDGTNVYQARALLKHYDTTEYFNPCEYNIPVIIGNRLMSGSKTELNSSKAALATRVFPNPATTELNITTELDDASLFIFNIVGQLIIETALSSETKLNVADLKNGTYLYKVIKDGVIIKTDKLIISK